LGAFFRGERSYCGKGTCLKKGAQVCRCGKGLYARHVYNIMIDGVAVVRKCGACKYKPVNWFLYITTFSIKKSDW